MVEPPLQFNVAEPWGRQPFDIETEYAAFLYLLSLGPNRNLRDVARATGRKMSTLERWAPDYCWAIRAAAYDKRALVQVVRAEIMPAAEHADVDTTIEARLDLLRDGFRVMKAALEPYKEDMRRGVPIIMKLPEISFCLEKLIKLERLLLGQSTDNVAVKEEFDMSKLTIDEVRTWRDLAVKALVTPK